MSIVNWYKTKSEKITQSHRMKEMVKKALFHSEVKLSKEEVLDIKKFWGEQVNKRNIKCFATYKYYHGHANPQIVPSDFYLLATSMLNRRWSKGFLSHKANLHYFIPAENRPITIISALNGHLRDAKNEVLTAEKAISILSKYELFVFKPAIGSGGGKGVVKYENASRQQLEIILKHRDFIVQEVVKQSPFFAAFNSSSVNTLRMETLNLNDQCDVLSSFIRIGAKDSFTDNISGHRGCVVGVNDSGNLSSFGLDKNYDKVCMAPSGLKFEGLSVPNYDEIKNVVISYHKQFPGADIINWDIAVDENDNVIVIEINLDSMNPCYHQIFNGPIFHGRTCEVMSFVDNLLLKQRSL